MQIRIRLVLDTAGGVGLGLRESERHHHYRQHVYCLLHHAERVRYRKVAQKHVIHYTSLAQNISKRINIRK